MDTFGWDVVFAADVAIVNKSLANSTSSLVSAFSFEAQGFTVNGQFGIWSIVPGGSGKLVLLKIDIRSGRLVQGSGDAVDLAGVAVVLKVSLQWLPAPSGSADTTLQFNFTDGEGRRTASGDGSGVTLQEVIAPPGLLSPLQESALGMAVATCLVENAARMSFVLATVNPMASSGAPWLRPVEMDYCYAEIVGARTPLLAILSVTSQRDITKLERRIDPSLLRGTGDTGLAISPGLFMENVFVPAIAQSFHTSTTSFVTGADAVVRNQAAVDLQTVAVGPLTYSPKMSSCVARVLDDHVEVQLSGTCDMGLNITMHFSGSSTIVAALDPSTASLQFSVAGSPAFQKSVDIPWYDSVLVGLAGVLGELILQVVVSAIGSALGQGIQDAARMGDVAKYTPKLVQWAGSTGFVPKQAGLASALYLRGDSS